jgi:Fur family ferric uptake transcriptional regulator
VKKKTSETELPFPLSNKAEEIARRLQDQGKKLTHQRLHILEKILNFRRHFTAEELEWTLKKEGKGNSKATIYRTLSLLLEYNILESQDFGDGSKYYEHLSTEDPHHDHLICVSCKKIIEFHQEQIERLQEIVAKENHFKILYHSHRLFGLCQRCLRNPS